MVLMRNFERTVNSLFSTLNLRYCFIESILDIKTRFHIIIKGTWQSSYHQFKICNKKFNNGAPRLVLYSKLSCHANSQFFIVKTTDVFSLSEPQVQQKYPSKYVDLKSSMYALIMKKSYRHLQDKRQFKRRCGEIGFEVDYRTSDWY